MLKNIWNIFKKVVIIGLRVMVVILVIPVCLIGIIAAMLNSVTELIEGENRDG